MDSSETNTLNKAESSMATGWDLTITNRDQQLVLVAEVKTKIGATAEWAAKLRRNIFAHGIFPNAPYFLIILPNHLYIWQSSEANLDLIAPTYIIDAYSIFQPYFERADITADKISVQSFQLIVGLWLSDLIHKTRHELGYAQHWVLDLGLYDAIVGGRLNYEVF